MTERLIDSADSAAWDHNTNQMDDAIKAAQAVIYRHSH